MRWAQAATGRVAAALFGEKSLQSHLPGANFDLWRCSRAPEAGHLGKIGYKEFHLDEPWDSDHNKKLIEKMPGVFRGPNSKLNEQGKTVFLAPTGKGTAWPSAAGLRFPAGFTDGTSNTILLILADDAHAVEWTKPEDLKYDPAKPHAGLGQRAGPAFLVGLADGMVRALQPTISKETLRNAFDPADGNLLGEDW